MLFFQSSPLLRLIANRAVTLWNQRDRARPGQLTRPDYIFSQHISDCLRLRSDSGVR